MWILKPDHADSVPVRREGRQSRGPQVRTGQRRGGGPGREPVGPVGPSRSLPLKCRENTEIGTGNLGVARGVCETLFRSGKVSLPKDVEMLHYPFFPGNLNTFDIFQIPQNRPVFIVLRRPTPHPQSFASSGTFSASGSTALWSVLRPLVSLRPPGTPASFDRNERRRRHPHERPDYSKLEAS